jgi:hypothetical protein
LKTRIISERIEDRIELAFPGPKIRPCVQEFVQEWRPFCSTQRASWQIANSLNFTLENAHDLMCNEKRRNHENRNFKSVTSAIWKRRMGSGKMKATLQVRRLEEKRRSCFPAPSLEDQGPDPADLHKAIDRGYGSDL